MADKTGNSWLEDGTRVVRWTESATVVVGYRRCAGCGTPTPEPTHSDLIAFAKLGGSEFMWPGERWMPPGWESDTIGLICPGCGEAKTAAFRQRREAHDAR